MSIPRNWHEAERTNWRTSFSVSKQKPYFYDNKITYFNHVLITYEKEGWRITFPFHMNSFAVLESFTKVLNKVIGFKLFTYHTDGLWVKKHLVSHKNYPVIYLDYDRSKIFLGENKILAIGDSPTRIVAKNGHKVRMGDWVITRKVRKAGANLFHACDVNFLNIRRYKFEDTIFYESVWSYSPLHDKECAHCKCLIPKDVAVTADMISKMSRGK